VPEATVRRLVKTGKAMGNVHQCWWRIRQEIIFFPGLNITCYAFYIHL
jgi:hypothetical protein